MSGIGHLLVGNTLNLFLLTSIEVTPQQFIAAMGVSTVSSLLPDIDAENSRLKVVIHANGRSPITDELLKPKYRKRKQKRVIEPLIHTFASGLEILIRQILRASITLCSKIIPHRGPTHYLITSIGLSIIFLIVLAIMGWSSIYALVFFIGYTSHIMGDAMTHYGVAFLYPWSKSRHHILPHFLRFEAQRFLSIPEIITVLVICALTFGLKFVIS